MKVNILVVDDHELMRKGIRSVLETDPRIVIVGEAQNGRAALEMAEKNAPHVIIMDLAASDLNCRDTIKLLDLGNNGYKLIVLTMQTTPYHIKQALESGAKGYVIKDCSGHELVEAVHKVAGNCVYLSPRVLGVIAHDYRSRSLVPAVVSRAVLSAREREVVQLISEGKNTKEVASLLEVSIKTVETHRSNIMKKLNCRSIGELVRYAIREGISHL